MNDAAHYGDWMDREQAAQAYGNVNMGEGRNWYAPLAVYQIRSLQARQRGNSRWPSVECPKCEIYLQVWAGGYWCGCGYRQAWAVAE